MFRPELTDFYSSLTLYRMRSILSLLVAAGASLLPAALLLFMVWSGGSLIRSGILWGVVALFSGAAAIRWPPALTLLRTVRDLRKHPRLALRQEGLVIRNAARKDSGVDHSRSVLLPWDQLERVEPGRKRMMPVLELTGELLGAPSGTGQIPRYELTADYSEIELGCRLVDVADTIKHYWEDPDERGQLPMMS
jgi:hypothetical protein